MNKKGCEGCSSVILFVIFCVLTIFAFQMSSTPPGPVTCNGQVMSPGDLCDHITKKEGKIVDTRTNTYGQEKAEQESSHNNTEWVFVIPAVLATLCLVYMVYQFIPSKKKQQAQLAATTLPQNGPPPYPNSAPRPGGPPEPYYHQHPPYSPPRNHYHFPPQR